MNDYDGDWIRGELGKPYAAGTGTIKVKATGEDAESKTVSVPRHIYHAMLEAVPVPGALKPLPETFDGREIVLTVRANPKPGLKKHRAVIVCRYEDAYADEAFRTMYSVHWLHAPTDDASWHGWLGAYDLTSFDEAYNEVTRRLETERMISSF